MTRTSLLRKRGLIILIAVVALTTLTAGTAAAATNRAKNIEAVGGVGFVGLAPGGTVGSEFKIRKNGDIRWAKIDTVGEVVGGAIVAMTHCDEKGKHSEGACAHAGAILNGGGILSIHSSSVKLKISSQEAPYIPGLIEIPVIRGKLRGSLGASLAVTGANGEQLTGIGKLRIRGSEPDSAYGCLLGVDADGMTPVWGTIQHCMDSPGPNTLGYYLDPSAGPVMVPVELHVRDTGRFRIASDETKMKGKLTVTVDSDPISGTSGAILITKGVATFTHDH